MLLSNYVGFLDNIFKKLQGLELRIEGLELDHIGYQTESKSDYEKLLPRFSAFATLLEEAVVNGRKVAIFKLNSPLKYKDRTIEAIELYEPRDGQVCPSALEHAEFVLTESFDSFVKKYPTIEFDTSKIDQPKFPQLSLRVDKNVQIKFHKDNVLNIVKKGKKK